jgi:hypothetical protein
VVDEVFKRSGQSDLDMRSRSWRTAVWHALTFVDRMDLFMSVERVVINHAGRKENAMTDDDMKAELERLRSENAALKCPI